jgi:hypothetical protein
VRRRASARAPRRHTENPAETTHRPADTSSWPSCPWHCICDSVHGMPVLDDDDDDDEGDEGDDEGDVGIVDPLPFLSSMVCSSFSLSP